MFFAISASVGHSAVAAGWLVGAPWFVQVEPEHCAGVTGAGSLALPPPQATSNGVAAAASATQRTMLSNMCLPPCLVIIYALKIGS
ncbi:conserved hypothetical protein [Paraburkholderia tropica]|nr:conserved hypothetical protein [Paraburkholderia tropica]